MKKFRPEGRNFSYYYSAKRTIILPQADHHFAAGELSFARSATIIPPQARLWWFSVGKRRCSAAETESAFAEGKYSFARSEIIISPKADLSQFHLLRKLKSRQPQLSGFYVKKITSWLQQ